MNNKVIFLQVEDTLVSSRSILACCDNTSFDPVSVKLVLLLAKMTDSKIVLCSNYTEYKNPENELYAKNGLKEYLHKDSSLKTIAGFGFGVEIREWLARNETLEYVILSRLSDDDKDDDFTETLKLHQLDINYSYGFTTDQMNMARTILSAIFPVSAVRLNIGDEIRNGDMYFDEAVNLFVEYKDLHWMNTYYVNENTVLPIRLLYV